MIKEKSYEHVKAFNFQSYYLLLDFIHTTLLNRVTDSDIHRPDSFLVMMMAWASWAKKPRVLSKPEEGKSGVMHLLFRCCHQPPHLCMIPFVILSFHNTNLHVLCRLFIDLQYIIRNAVALILYFHNNLYSASTTLITDFKKTLPYLHKQSQQNLPQEFAVEVLAMLPNSFCQSMVARISSQ